MATAISKSEICHHRIKRILKSYQESAERSLSGPISRSEGAAADAVPGTVCRVNVAESAEVYAAHNVHILPKITSTTTVQSGLRKDNVRRSSTSSKKLPEKRIEGRGKFGGCTKTSNLKPAASDEDITVQVVETIIEGQSIASFVIAGEPRLCVPHFLNKVLCNFSEAELFQVCEELNISLQRCNDAQLLSLKKFGILLLDVKHCGLITKSDAERLCGALVHHRQQELGYRFRCVADGVKVSHECFGGCKGIFVLEAYTTPTAACIQCCECDMMLMPSHFVCHSHKVLEVNTQHWGFESSNWRAYVLLSADQNERERFQRLLDEIKMKFEFEEKEEVEDEHPNKRFCYDKSIVDPKNDPPKWTPSNLAEARWQTMTLLRQIKSNSSLTVETPSYLYTGTPILASSEQMGCYSEAQRNDRNFTPNVTLAPEVYLKLREEFEDEEMNKTCDDPPMRRKMSMSSAFSTTMSAKTAEILDDNDYDDDSDTESVLSDKLPAKEDEEVVFFRNISSELEAKSELLKMVLSGDTSATKQERIEQFVMMQKRHMAMISALQDDKAELEKKILESHTTVNNCLDEAMETRKRLEEEIAGLKQENTMKMRDAAMERYGLLQQIEMLSNGTNTSDLAQMADQYKKEADQLKSQLQNVEQDNAYLIQEISKFRMQKY